MSATVVLVHSPLVGPSSWSWVAERLRDQGHDTVVPDLTGAQTFADHVAGARQALLEGGLVLVGHSGAGLLLPFIGEGRPVRHVFVDAHLPPRAGALQLAGGEFRTVLENRADGAGLLPKWNKWYEESVVARMVRDTGRRATVVADIPRLPLSFYDDEPVVPEGWDRAPCAYLLFSKAYETAAVEAEGRGWPVCRLPGDHLHLVTEPEAVADRILELSS